MNTFLKEKIINKVWLIITDQENVGIQVAGVYTNIILCHKNVIAILRRWLAEYPVQNSDEIMAMVNKADKIFYIVEKAEQHIQEAINLWNRSGQKASLSIWEESTNVDVE